MESKILSASLPCLRSWHPVQPFRGVSAITVQQDWVLSHHLSKNAFDNAVVPLECLSAEMALKFSTLNQSGMHFVHCHLSEKVH